MSAEMTQWIIDTMISMTLLMAFVLFIRKPVSHYFGAKVAYALWALPVARLFMPILTLEAPAQPAAPTAPVAAGTAISDMAMTVPAEQVATGTLASVDWVLVALILWAGGAGMLFISKLASYTQFREDIVSDGQLVGKHGNIRILETAAVGGPLAFGLFQKYIAVPTDFFRNYSPAERELALEHEIAHHEAGDLFANFAGLLILSLHWFNPVAWFAWVAFREDQETACDARILQKSGREVRAVYGRTIAKSASGHKLGLASPLNQKDKIKGRLKMLGSSEKSGFRKKLGMLMVGASTVVALPATATVVYVEADIAEEAHPANHAGVQVQNVGTTVDVGDKGVLVTEKTEDGYKYTVSNKRGTFEFKSKRKLKRSEIDKKLSKMVPSYKKLSEPQPPEAPARPEPAAGDGDQKVVNITMFNGSMDYSNDKQYVHRIKHDGKTIILRTNRKLSKAEIQEKIEEAEESRIEAEADLRDHERDMNEHEREMKEHRREMRIEMREIEREVEEARREANRAMRESQREVQRAVWEAGQEAMRAKREALREKQKAHRATRKTTRVWSIANQVAEISFAPRAPIAPKPATAVTARTAPQIDCTAMNKQLAFSGKNGKLDSHAWAVVAGCGTFKVDIDEKKLMEITLRGLERDRAEAAKCNDNSKLKRQKLRAYDRDIKKLKDRLSMT